MMHLAEKKYEIEEFNKTKFEFPRDKCMPNLLWEQAHLQPTNIAVVHNDKSLNYKELVESSLDLARYLQHLGTVPDECVGIYIDPSIEMMISVWGILSAGSAYLPLSPEYPDDRIKYMIDDSCAKIVITQKSLKNKLLSFVPKNIKIITLENVKRFKESVEISSHFNLKTDLKPSNLAYVIYTSGSSGKPKGVMIEHRSIANQMYWLKHAFNFTNHSVILQKTPISFDAAQWEILAPGCGSKIIMGSPGISKNPVKLIETIVKHKVTMLQCVPTLLQALLDLDEISSCKTLVQIFSGGEALSKNLAKQCLNVLPKCTLINLYGPTECTINTSAFIMNPETVSNVPSTISIGAPINNMHYYILDNKNLPLNIGQVGELSISGEGLARGYLNQPGLTALKFVDNPFHHIDGHTKLYKTGDLAYWNKDGTVQYVCRLDNQIKLRGFRIELDEIKAVIDAHDWVKNSAVILKKDPFTGCENLVAFIELNPKEAALMDQGNHGPHHQSKESKAQVLMQLSNKRCREKSGIAECIIDLPGKQPTQKQVKTVFSRKTYRFFNGGKVRRKDILQLLNNKISQKYFIKTEDLSYADFGEILRYFGQYISEERLLPKYGYASPGALYATQIYLEINTMRDLKPGYYYYHPVYHQLILVNDQIDTTKTGIKLHFIGKKSAIEPIYKNNIQEVLEIEVGHIVGLFEMILPEYGLNIANSEYEDSTKNYLNVADEDLYLGTFQIVEEKKDEIADLVDIYVQVHPKKVNDLEAGQYRYKDGSLEKVSDEIILKKHVIAINQEVYNRSSFGITTISKLGKNWMSYINLGRMLQILQMNDINIGLMSSGYSSKTGNDLPSAKIIGNILGANIGPSYFFIGGRISDQQKYSFDMSEDAVHMKGPTEMIKDDLINFLPNQMLPNKVIVLDKIPLTANGKINYEELKKINVEIDQKDYVAPTSEIEKSIQTIWQNVLKRKNISIQSNLFELGGNSLLAVNIINRINKEFNLSLLMQVIFESPTIEKLALRVNDDANTVGRIVKLQAKGCRKPVYCWPGLGGYCMNLQLLAQKLGHNQPFYGVQAYGINKNETPYLTLKEMADADIKRIKSIQPEGPYTLWGYSFGAKVAFEVAYQLERAGEVVDSLILIAPGMPIIDCKKVFKSQRALYNNKIFLTILFSVFMGSITDLALEECLRYVSDEESFIKFILKRNNMLDLELIKRIINIVSITYEFRYSVGELKEKRLKAAITIFKANGDQCSFLESNKNLFSLFNVKLIDLQADHYSILKEPSIDELVNRIKFEMENRILLQAVG